MRRVPEVRCPVRALRAAVLGLLAVGCPAFDSYVTPKDPSQYPCGKPDYSSCAPQEGCCEPKTYCDAYGGCTDSTVYPGFATARRHKRVLATKPP